MPTPPRAPTPTPSPPTLGSRLEQRAPIVSRSRVAASAGVGVCDQAVRNDSVTHPSSTMTRRFGLLHATALNMTNMIGIGPFITIPLLMSALGGPQAMLGWLVALVIVMCDSMVWSELGAAMPGSGGSFGYLRQGYGPETFGRLMGVLFVWQFVFSGPLEIASGYIGFANYLGYLWTGITAHQTMLVVTVVGLSNLALLY